MKYFKLLIALFLLSSCGQRQTETKIISVTIEPQRYFAERIGGDKFIINTVVPVGQSPETYDPTPQQMMKISESTAYLQIGHIGFEQAWIENIKQNNPQVSFFDMSKGMTLLEIHGDHTHAHAPDEHGHHHHHGPVDPHIWSSIEGARTVAWNTLHAFVELDRENSGYYWENFNKLIEEIENTENEIIKILSPVLSRAFIIYHPALTYFAEEFNLTQLCIEMDGKEPSPAQLKELVDTAKNYNVQVVFIQQEFDRKNAELIAKETGCRLVTINPLAYDWSKEIIHIAKTLANE